MQNYLRFLAGLQQAFIYPGMGSHAVLQDADIEHVTMANHLPRLNYFGYIGAEVKQVVGMLVWVFVKIFLIASVVALPMAYFLSEYWLKSFAYKKVISPMVFIGSLIGLLLITLFTVSYETWKAARTNPVNSLRSE